MFGLNLNNSEQKIFTKEKSLFEDKFYRLMFELGLYNKFNKTYNLQIIEKTLYGFLAKIYLEPGLSFQELQKNIGIIQENLNCIWIMRTEQFLQYANLKIVIRPVDPNTEYVSPLIKPWEMYLGLDFSLNKIVNNNNDYCMFLLAGATGSGKTRFTYMVLMSWILSCTPQQVELYIGDVAKNEFVNLQYVKHVRYYASELDQLCKMLQYTEKKIEKRKKVISKLREEGLATNIVEYNSLNKIHMSYCYIFIDEFSIIMPDKSDGKEETKTKQTILDSLKKVSKIGRSLGVFCFIATQKTTRDELPAIIKNMSAVRISFRANDSISSEVILGDNSAVGLANRYAVYSQNGGEKKDYLFSPSISTSRIKELIAKHVDKSYRKADIENLIFTEAYEENIRKPVQAKKLVGHSSTSIEDKTIPTIPKIQPVKKGDDYIGY